MGLNNENARRVVFDLETAPIVDAAEYLIEPISAPSNYKDPDKIAAFIAEAQTKALDKCSLDPDLARIVALGWQAEDGPVTVRTCQDEEQERDAINEFWNVRFKYQSHVVGFNCLAFDLPVLLRRALYLNADRPDIQIDKFKHPSVSDLQQILSFNGTSPWHSLDFYTKRMGIIVPDVLTGAEIGQAVQEGRWSDIAAHCQADVVKTAALAQRLGLFRMAETAHVI